MTDFRALCAELVVIEDALSGGNVQLSSQGQSLDGYAALAAFRYIADKARILLVHQETGEPTDEELLRIAANAIEPYESSGIAIGEYEPETECAVEAYGSELIAYARSVLARWGTPNSAEVGRSLGDAPQPADGEVAELAAKLRRRAPQNPLGIADPTILRAADMLERGRQVEDLAADAVSALRYIEQSHGRLYGVGFDRVYEKADRLRPAHALPLPTTTENTYHG